jgi:hypothetical protein
MKEIKGIPGLDPEVVVTIKKFNYDEKSQLLGKTLKLNVTSRTKEFTTDFGAYRLYALVYGIDNAPFFGVGIDKLQAVKKLDADTGDHIFEEIQKYNSLENLDEIKKKLS